MVKGSAGSRASLTCRLDATSFPAGLCVAQPHPPAATLDFTISQQHISFFHPKLDAPSGPAQSQAQSRAQSQVQGEGQEEEEEEGGAGGVKTRRRAAKGQGVVQVCQGALWGRECAVGLGRA